MPTTVRPTGGFASAMSPPTSGDTPSVSFFLPLLEHHDRRSFELFCYANATRSDDMTERIKRALRCLAQHCRCWPTRPSRKWFVPMESTFWSICRVIRTGTVCFSLRKPAPIQVTYLGYPNTTGMMAIDYRLTDALADPPGMTDHLNVEKLWRLPACAWCYQPPEDAPDIQPRSGWSDHVRMFQRLRERSIPNWRRSGRNCSNGVPGSRLLLKSTGAGEASSRQRLTGQFAEHGIPIERIEMLGRIADPRRHLELYHRVDVAFGHLSLSRHDDHLRSVVDGRTRGEPGRPDARFAGGSKPAQLRRPAGIDREDA